MRCHDLDRLKGIDRFAGNEFELLARAIDRQKQIKIVHWWRGVEAHADAAQMVYARRLAG